MKAKKRSVFKMGVLASMTAAGTIYYFMKKHDKSAGAVIDQGLDSLEDAAYEANRVFKDAQSYAQSKAKGMFRNVQYHAENIKDGFEDGAERVEDGFNDVSKDLKKNVEKTL